MKSKRENVSSSLNDDSCFWAHVEEALILLKNGVLTPDDKRKLIEFENYVWNALKNYAVSPEIFLEKSSFMKWWTVYKEIIDESFYPSLFADFMNCQSYHQYEEGVWCPPDFESNEYREIGDKWKMRIQQSGENLKSGVWINLILFLNCTPCLVYQIRGYQQICPFQTTAKPIIKNRIQ